MAPQQYLCLDAGYAGYPVSKIGRKQTGAPKGIRLDSRPNGFETAKISNSCTKDQGMNLSS